ncbi:MAG: dissimilatory-type sulfite reductase subunit alpha [Deltaproteobacteria bacterium]|nr:dissimilatory-type sulfite reductase subunit alpha [Deltaproteobacteria bacterium]
MTDNVKKHETPLLDELLKGPWPSFVKEFKTLQDKKAVANDLLGQLEYSYKTKLGYWKHGGIVGVMGYGGGVIGRYSSLAEMFPAVKHFHTIRVNQPAGWFYTSKALRTLCDIWEKRGSGITNMHGSTGDIVFLGTNTEELEPIFEELTKEGFDLGGSGSNLRTPSCCNGQARCEWACYDTMGLCYDLTQTFQDELHRPQFPYKFKIKMAGCPNDCVASIARSDLSIIGTWRDNIQMDQSAVLKYASDGLDIQKIVVMNCPTKCLDWNGKELKIDNSNCVKCMHCINVMPKALAPGKDRGATVLLGSKAPIIEGAMLSSVLIPFIKLEPPFKELKDVIGRIWEPWAEHGKNRERIGEFIERVGKGNFLEEVGIDPVPEMVKHPRENPYIFYDEYLEDE